MIIIIPGTPIAKKRPRFVRRGKFVATYNAQETEEGRFLFEVYRQIGNHKPFKCACLVNMAFYFARPKSHYGTGRNAGILKKTAPTQHITKIDVDNAIKFVFDCFNGVIWHDDSQVVGLTAIKCYADEARTEIDVRWSEDKND